MITPMISILNSTEKETIVLRRLEMLVRLYFEELTRTPENRNIYDVLNQLECVRYERFDLNSARKYERLSRRNSDVFVSDVKVRKPMDD